MTVARRKPRSPSRVADPVLVQLGERVRDLRAIRGMSRKILARDAGVSERFLADLESGVGNASILLLTRLAQALALPVTDLLGGERDQSTNLARSMQLLTHLSPERLAERDQSTNLARSMQLLTHLSPERLAEAHQWLRARFAPASDSTQRARRIALIGLRGAGKSTLGRLLAAELRVPFVELDDRITSLSGMDTAQIHGMLGQSAYRRYELKALEAIVEEAAAVDDASGRPDAGVVIAAPGSIVSEPETFGYLLANCYTVWIKASPEEHMARVIAQGDLRPMAGNREAMDDLRRILANREPLYSQADVTIETAGRSVAEALDELTRILPSGAA